MSTPQHYNDGQADPQDATDQRSVDFDWEGLENALGESELGPVEYQRLAFALGQVLRWLMLPKAGGGRNRQRVIVRRLVVLAWTIDPQIFDDASLAKLSKRFRIPYHSAHHHSQEATGTYNLHNSHQYRRKTAKLKNHANHPRAKESFFRGFARW